METGGESTVHPNWGDVAGTTERMETVAANKDVDM